MLCVNATVCTCSLYIHSILAPNAQGVWGALLKTNLWEAFEVRRRCRSDMIVCVYAAIFVCYSSCGLLAFTLDRPRLLLWPRKNDFCLISLIWYGIVDSEQAKMTVLALLRLF